MIEPGGAVRNERKPNKVREIRESKMMSKAELARKTGLSVQTVDRVEKGYYCRLDTKRKILIALGLDLDDRNGVFCED
ncbi:MAG: helix-turn-helix transcriptional regulator [Nitrospinae bacterium]|nr:helix-turn-helix transcriptional regulator [Nitrospinota bacterium]